jgi:hypothetical protein
VDEIQKLNTAVLNSFAGERLLEVLQQLNSNPEFMCIAAGGNCFEGEHCSSELNLIQWYLRVQSHYLSDLVCKEMKGKIMRFELTVM